MAGRWAHSAATVLLLGSVASAQTLDLGPVPKPRRGTTDTLVVRFMAANDEARSERERAIVSVGSRLARTGDPVDELAAQTISRGLDELIGLLREAERMAASAETDAVVRQRLREALIRLDASAGAARDSEDVRRGAERLLGDVAAVLHAAGLAGGGSPPRLQSGGRLPDAGELQERAGRLDEGLERSGVRLGELVAVYERVRGVPALEGVGVLGLRSAEGVLDFAEMSADGFIARSARTRLGSALEACLMDGSGPRSAGASLEMMRALARIGALVERCAGLEGDTARRVEPVLGSMMDRLRSPEDAELLRVLLVPLERSLGLVERGAGLPSAGAVSAQLQFAWRFLLPQEQAARVAAIDAIGRILADPSAMASPDTVSALVAHADLVESLESLLGVDVLQRELDGAGVAGAFGALEALRRELRQMGDRTGYREAGARVLPIVRTLARYREMPGRDEVLDEREGEPEWVAGLRGLLDERLGALRVRLAMELIGTATGEGETNDDAERIDAQQSLETLRRLVIAAADVLVLLDGGMERLGALPEFETFDGSESLIGLSGIVGLDELGVTIEQAIGEFERDDALGARSLLDSVAERLVIAGVLAECARQARVDEGDAAVGGGLEAALVWRRMADLGDGAAAAAELSLTGSYRARGVEISAVRRYAADQAERMIDRIDWLREAWQRRR